MKILAANLAMPMSGCFHVDVNMYQGKSAGNALQWTYTLLVEVDGKTWEVAFDDWMFLQPDQVVINRTEMSKFGLKVGDVTMVFGKGNRQGEGS